MGEGTEGRPCDLHWPRGACLEDRMEAGPSQASASGRVRGDSVDVGSY